MSSLIVLNEGISRKAVLKGEGGGGKIDHFSSTSFMNRPLNPTCVYVITESNVTRRFRSKHNSHQLE